MHTKILTLSICECMYSAAWRWACDFVPTTTNASHFNPSLRFKWISVLFWNCLANFDIFLELTEAKQIQYNLTIFRGKDHLRWILDFSSFVNHLVHRTFMFQFLFVFLQCFFLVFFVFELQFQGKTMCN